MGLRASGSIHQIPTRANPPYGGSLAVAAQAVGKPGITPPAIAAGGAVPDPPATFTAVGEIDVVQCAWSASVGATSYDVMRGPKGGPLTLLVNVPGTTFNDDTAAFGQVYDYAARARNAAGASANSDVDNAGIADLMEGSPAFWAMNVASGNVPDSGLGGHTMTNRNGVTFAAGVLGNAAVFDAALSQSMDTPVAGVIQVSTEVSIAFWIKFDEAGTGRRGIFALGDGNDLWMERNASSVNIGFGGLANFAQASGFGHSSWVHVAVVYNGNLVGNANRLKLFVNGAQVTIPFLIGTFPASISPTGLFKLGTETVIGGFMLGMMDEVYFCPRAITVQEVQELFLFGEPVAFPWPWYDDSEVRTEHVFDQPDGTLLVGQAPAPVNLDGLTWAVIPGTTCDWEINSAQLEMATGGGAGLDDGRNDKTITVEANIGPNMVYAAVEIRVRCPAFGDGVFTDGGLWNHNKYQGDCELLKLDPAEALLFPGVWAADRLFHTFVVKIRGNVIQGYVDGNLHWQGTTALFAAETRFGLSQASPGSAASGALATRLEVRIGEQFPPYPLGY